MTIKNLIENTTTRLKPEDVIYALNEKYKAHESLSELIPKLKALQASLEEKMKGLCFVSEDISSKNIESLNFEIKDLHKEIRLTSQLVTKNNLIIKLTEDIYKKYVEMNIGPIDAIKPSINSEITYWKK